MIMKQRSKYLLLLITLLFIGVPKLAAQTGGMIDPVKFSQQINDDGKKTVTVSITARVIDGWHLYDQNLPAGGPVSLEFHTDKLKGAKALGGFKANKAPHRYTDEIFNIEVREFAGTVTFSQQLEITDPKALSMRGSSRVRPAKTTAYS